jgi:hypothetical protein
MYLDGRFRWEPEQEHFDTVGEAETWDFLADSDTDEALNAAWALETGWSDEASAWFNDVVAEELQVALEQCCHNGELLPAEIRALRLQRFPHADQVRAEHAIRCLPTDEGGAALALICWWVRIARAKRTGSPDLDPKRSLRIPG